MEELKQLRDYVSQVGATTNCVLARLDEIEEKLDKYYVLKPIAADGEPINIGERVRNPAHCYYVRTLVYKGNNKWVVGGYSAKEVSHEEEPSVQKILEDMLKDFEVDKEVISESKEYIAYKYGEKLRLAGDE